MKQTVFSGIQPTGIVHLGNYLGAIRHFVAMQNDYNCIYCIVDLHAITVRQDPQELKENIRRLAAWYLACGIDIEKSILFVQSHVKEHAELAWLLNCYTQMGELERMTQFKDKSLQNKENINVGLFAYPVLQAADVLLYNTNSVPVGEDQKQHIELCRDIAKRFNGVYGDVFVLPKPLIAKTGARIMGLDDPNIKMSKSAKSVNNYISLLDDESIIRKKILRAVTDSDNKIIYNKESKPAISNLLTIYSLVVDQSIQELENKYKNKGYGDFKKDLAQEIINFVQPIQKKYNDFYNHPDQLDKILSSGAKSAQAIVSKNIIKIKKAIGLL
ncbi:MAG: tryptophan--tRNA ligase [Patescibacteria group bacterium]